MNPTSSATALVTGATSGIGRATAKCLVARGWKVFVTGRRQAELDSLGAECPLAGSLALDLTSPEAAQILMDSAVGTLGRLDGLVHAAGILTGGGLDHETDDGFLQLMNVNLNASWFILKRAWEPLKASRGSAVLVSSVTGLRAFPNLAGYCVSKAAVDQLVRCAALDGAPHGVRVNGINPGVVVTNLHKEGGMGEQKYETFLEHSKTTHPLGRVGTAEEVAETIAFLLGPESGWTTGISFPIDGGRQLTCAR